MTAKAKTKPPALAAKIKLVPIDDLTPYGNNPRNNGAAVAKVAASIGEFGFQVPIVADENLVILAGHTRLLAARQLGLAKVPVIVAANLTPQQKRAFRVADNKVGEAAEWDDAKLKAELDALQTDGFALECLGFEADELDILLGNAVIEDPDVDAEPPQDSYKEQYGVIVICADEKEQRAAFEALKDSGYKCRVVTT